MAKVQTKTSSTQPKNEPDILQITNQVQAQPDALFGGVKMAGGNIVGHTMTNRFMLKKHRGKERASTVADSPLLPDSSAEFMVDECGIRDIPGKRAMKAL